MNNLNELLSREYWIQYLELATEGGLTDGAIANDIITGIEKAINYSHCCKSDSELLPDAEKEKLIDDAYWLNLQNLSGREHFDKAFRLGIEVGVDETLEKLQS